MYTVHTYCLIICGWALFWDTLLSTRLAQPKHLRRLVYLKSEREENVVEADFVQQSMSEDAVNIAPFGPSLLRTACKILSLTFAEMSAHDTHTRHQKSLMMKT